MKLRAKLLIFSILCALFSYGQNTKPAFKRELKGISGSWHKVQIPDEVYNHTQDNLKDIRVIGITQTNDTLEAPYILKMAGSIDSTQTKSFKILNQSYNGKTYFSTFEMPQAEEVNELGLDFNQSNFDWNVKLEGSNDASNWFTVIDNYRIVAISNELTTFKFTTLKFGTAKYRYFRIAINSAIKPELNETFLSKNVSELLNIKRFSVKKMTVKENKAYKTTEVEIELINRVPVSSIKLMVASAFDYFRPVNIEYVVDSFKTEKGWKYNYETIGTDVLNSKGSNTLNFKTVFAKKIKLVIVNADNQTLKLSNVEVAGNIYEMLIRFTEKANYYFRYGGEDVNRPNYDITHFQSELPSAITILQLGNEVEIPAVTKDMAKPLISNNWWLWAIMGIVIFVLGWFTLKMIKEV